MGNIFGKPKNKESRITEQDRAVLELKKQRDKLKQYQKKVVVQLEKDREIAKKLLKEGKKEKAKLMLRKKRFQESMLNKADGQLDNIERLVNDLEFAQVQSQVVAGLKSGNEALKKMHQVLSIEDVEKILDETEESVEYQREIDSLLAGGLTQEDESDVLQELDDIIKESQPAQPAADENINLELPDVPTDRIKDKTKKAEEPLEPMLAT